MPFHRVYRDYNVVLKSSWKTNHSIQHKEYLFWFRVDDQDQAQSEANDAQV